MFWELALTGLAFLNRETGSKLGWAVHTWKCVFVIRHIRSGFESILR